MLQGASSNEKIEQSTLRLGALQRQSGPSDDDDDIKSRTDEIGRQAHRLADQAFASVALDGISDLSRRRDAKAPLGRLDKCVGWRRDDVHDEHVVPILPAVSVCPTKLPTVPERRRRMLFRCQAATHTMFVGGSSTWVLESARLDTCLPLVEGQLPGLVRLEHT